MKLKNLIVPAVAIVVIAAILLGVNVGTSALRAQNIQKEHIYIDTMTRCCESMRYKCRRKRVLITL